MLLIGATIVSILLGETTDGAIILLITVGSAALGYVQERGAVRAIAELLESVRVNAEVLRDGRECAVALDEVVPGDVLVLRAGGVIAGDARLLTSNSLLIDESALTGESFPVEKLPGTLPTETALGRRTNCIWCGTHVMSGTGTAVVVQVGADTEFGRIGTRLADDHVPTAFEIGLRRFGFMLMRAAGVLVAGTFVVNVALKRPVLESALFSLALAVGLTPQLLPAIVTVTLSKGARQLARRKVIVKRLDAIEDIGAIDVLCTDKTGTLTRGTVQLDRALGPDGQPSEATMDLAWLNARMQSGFANPIDLAILESRAGPGTEPRTGNDEGAPKVQLLGELPYDFTRQLLSVLVEDEQRLRRIITKGAFRAVLDRCDLHPGEREVLDRRFRDLSADGYRVLGLGVRDFAASAPSVLAAGDERSLSFAGFLCFSDPAKDDAASAIGDLHRLGVVIKMITGDNRHAAAAVASAVGLDPEAVIVGDDVDASDDTALQSLVERASVFAEITPMQKERIVRALRGNGHIVGFLGDGINDTPSLRIADVGISVDSATDVAKHTASVVLLEKDLRVLADGIMIGRTMFANTIKYTQSTIAANFGNMISMAATAIVLPFLPLIPRQILLLNFLSDFPAMTIATDRVDPETIQDPHGWDLRKLQRFMIIFGLISSAFDLMTFVVLRIGFHAGPSLFRTGWFIESTATELAVMLVLRTRRRAWRSRPSRALVGSSILVAVVTVALPFSTLADRLGFSRPTVSILAALVAITCAYVTATEIAKAVISKAAVSTVHQDRARPADSP